MDNVKISSNRSLRIVFFIVFLLIALYPLIYSENIRIWSLIISLVFLLLGTINPRILTPLNILWMKFGLFLGKIVSPIIIGLIFFSVVTPTGLIMRIFKKDLINLKFNNDKSYWINKNDPKSNMKNQF